MTSKTGRRNDGLSSTGLEQVGDEVEFDVAASLEVVIEGEESGELGEELGVLSLEIGFVEQFNGSCDDFQGGFAGVFGFGEFGGEAGQVAGGSGEQLFGGGEGFGAGGGSAGEVRVTARIKNLDAGEDGGQEGGGGLGE